MSKFVQNNIQMMYIALTTEILMATSREYLYQSQFMDKKQQTYSLMYISVYKVSYSGKKYKKGTYHDRRGKIKNGMDFMKHEYKLTLQSCEWLRYQLGVKNRSIRDLSCHRRR